MNKKVVIFATYTLWDPPIQNAVNSLLKDSWEVIVIHYYLEIPIFFNNRNFRIIFINDFRKLVFPAFFKALLAWFYYWLKVRWILALEKPDLIIAEMHRPLSAIPKPLLSKTICFIPDIPNIKCSGKLDRMIIRYGWRVMHKCFVVWSSDSYKAELTKKFAQLNYLPIICHNCPSQDYLENFDKNESRSWLLNLLKRNGLVVTDKSMILLRAGAVGEYGGIEETILAMKSLPSEFVFLLMGRPEEDYKSHLVDFIKENEMHHRTYLFNRPDDNEWRKILLAADIGHLIHIRPDDNPAVAAVYDLNSSLSNNRLFQYMAAGLPIISYIDPRMDVIYNEVDCFSIVDTANLTTNLIRTCNELLNNKDKRLAMGTNANSAFNEKYNWEKQFKKIAERLS